MSGRVGIECAKLCHPCDPTARFSLASVHRLHLPVPIDTTKVEDQEQDGNGEDQDENHSQCGHHLFNKKEKEH